MQAEWSSPFDELERILLDVELARLAMYLRLADERWYGPDLMMNTTYHNARRTKRSTSVAKSVGHYRPCIEPLHICSPHTLLRSAKGRSVAVLYVMVTMIHLVSLSSPGHTSSALNLELHISRRHRPKFLFEVSWPCQCLRKLCLVFEAANISGWETRMRGLHHIIALGWVFSH